MDIKKIFKKIVEKIFRKEQKVTPEEPEKFNFLADLTIIDSRDMIKTLRVRGFYESAEDMANHLRRIVENEFIFTAESEKGDIFVIDASKVEGAVVFGKPETPESE